MIEKRLCEASFILFEMARCGCYLSFDSANFSSNTTFEVDNYVELKGTTGLFHRFFFSIIFHQIVHFFAK